MNLLRQAYDPSDPASREKYQHGAPVTFDNIQRGLRVRHSQHGPGAVIGWRDRENHEHGDCDSLNHIGDVRVHFDNKADVVNRNLIWNVSMLDLSIEMTLPSST